MAARKAVTLIEIIVVLVIIGISATIAIPYLIVSSEQTHAQMAQNNLLAISAAQQKYFEDHGSYCVQVGCGDTTANLFAGLRLDRTADDPFSYRCSASGETIPYNCFATDTYIVNLTLDPNNQTPTPIVTCTSNGVANGPGCSINK